MNSFQWSNNLAYAVGLIVTDGNLSKDGRHLDLTSKDIEQLNNFKKCLGLKVKIGWKSSGFSDERYPRVQFGDVKFYRWLETIGIHPNKSKTVGPIIVPDKYFFDFLRGSFDGDGCFYSYWDKRWKSSFMMYLEFVSASESHMVWMHDCILKQTGLSGRLKRIRDFSKLVFAKKASKEIIKKMYQRNDCVYLSRKREKIIKAFKEENSK